MAAYTDDTAEHQTLVANTVDTVTLTAACDEVEIVNRDGAAEISFTVGVKGKVPADPTVDGAGTFVLPAAVDSKVVRAYMARSHGVVVKLISSGTPKYSVQALRP